LATLDHESQRQRERERERERERQTDRQTEMERERKREREREGAFNLQRATRISLQNELARTPSIHPFAEFRD
jgi:hypothetical protein